MIRSIPTLILALLLLCVPAAATETGTDETQTDETVQDAETETMTSETQVEGSNITVNVTVPAQEQTTMSEPESIEEEVSMPTAATYSVTTLDVEEVSEDAAQTHADTVEALFGPYTPRTQTVTEYLADGSVVESQQIVPGLAGLDYPWLASVTFFGLLMFCFFKMLGGLLK